MKMAGRKAERCDAMELEVMRMNELLSKAERNSEHCAAAFVEKTQAEERAESATRRAEFAEQRANAAERSAKSLELQLADVNTDLANCRASLEAAEAAEHSSSQATASAQRKLDEVMEALSASSVENAALRSQVDATESDLRSKLSLADRSQKEAATHLTVEMQRAQGLMERVSILEQELMELRQSEGQTRRDLDASRSREAENHILYEEKQKEIEMKEVLLLQKMKNAESEAAAAEKEVAPLRAEAKQCRAEANEALKEAQQRRLEAEATRMAHYEQEILR